MVPFGNPYMAMAGNYVNELQNMRDRIDSQIQQVQQQQQNMPQIPLQQPTNLTQNFQLANNSIQNNFKLVNNFDEVEKEIVLIDTYFLTHSFDNLWIKKPNGDIRTFNLLEVIKKDEKDLLIEKLQKQIEELQGGNGNEYDESNSQLLYEQSGTKSDGSIRKQFEKIESTNVSTISDSKTAKRKP